MKIKLQKLVSGMAIGDVAQLKLKDVDGQIYPNLAYLSKGKDYSYSVKLDKASRVYNISKIKRGTRFNFSRHVLGQVEHLKAGQHVKVDLAGRSRVTAQPTVSYVAELLNTNLSLNACKVTKDVYITRKASRHDTIQNDA